MGRPKSNWLAGSLPWLAPGVLVGALVPLAFILWRVPGGNLGADPIAEALNELGFVALILLLASLACTPLKLVTGWTWPIRLRRELGLLAFTYALLHVLTYSLLDQGLHLRAIWTDVLKRKFIFLGFSAFVLLVPLALTSTAASVRRLGFARWKLLHRLAYVAAALAAVHFYFRVKKDVTEPLAYAGVLGLLLALRLLALRRNRSREAVLFDTTPSFDPKGLKGVSEYRRTHPGG